jgi:hypothetical protein
LICAFRTLLVRNEIQGEMSHRIHVAAYTWNMVVDRNLISAVIMNKQGRMTSGLVYLVYPMAYKYLHRARLMISLINVILTVSGIRRIFLVDVSKTHAAMLSTVLLSNSDAFMFYIRATT